MATPHASSEIRPLWLLQTAVQLLRPHDLRGPRTESLPQPTTDPERQLLAYLSTAVSGDRLDGPVETRFDIDPHRQRKVAAIMDDIHLHYRRRRSVSQVARLHAMSESALQNLFRMSTGRSIHEYTTLVRVCRGVLALASTDGKVAQIARDVGYSSKKDFYRALRRHAGVSPSDIRALLPAARREFANSLAQNLAPALPVPSE